jgi:hypothetical protein
MPDHSVHAAIGPCQFVRLGTRITIRCPHDYDALMRLAGGVWDPGGGRWFIDPRRIQLAAVVDRLIYGNDTTFDAEDARMLDQLLPHG